MNQILSLDHVILNLNFEDSFIFLIIFGYFADILSEQVNVREASMNKWTLKFKDNNIELRFQSLYKKKTQEYSKFVSSVSLLFIEGFIFYRAILYEGGSFSKFSSSFYTIYFLGVFFLVVF